MWLTLEAKYFRVSVNQPTRLKSFPRYLTSLGRALERYVKEKGEHS
jgi:hypothetical protein